MSNVKSPRSHPADNNMIINAFTWLYKAWLGLLLVSRWLDASLTNHSNCAFLPGKVFITPRGKAHGTVPGVRGRLHRRHGLAARTACVICKTRTNMCLGREPMTARSVQCHTLTHTCVHALALRLSTPRLTPVNNSSFIFQTLANHLNRENSNYQNETYFKVTPCKFWDHKYFWNIHVVKS